MAKKKIDTRNKNEFEIIGVITSEKDYTLAWYLNEVLQLKFVKILSDFLNNDFSYYQSGDGKKKMILIENKTENGILISELKKFNFVLKITDIDFFNKNIKMKLKTTNDYIFSGLINKLKLTQKTKKNISEIEI